MSIAIPKDKKNMLEFGSRLLKYKLYSSVDISSDCTAGQEGLRSLRSSKILIKIFTLMKNSLCLLKFHSSLLN